MTSPDLTGRVIIVTGANAGVGKETAKALLSHNAKVYLAARSKEKAEAAIRELKQLTGQEGIFLKLDLSELSSVKAAAEEFLSGVMVPPHGQLTSQGYDSQFVTNVLGHFHFTTLLLPALIAGKNTSPNKKARVVTTSSGEKTSVESLYKDSKLGNILFANEFVPLFQVVTLPSSTPRAKRSELHGLLPAYCEEDAHQLSRTSILLASYPFKLSASSTPSTHNAEFSHGVGLVYGRGQTALPA
ncbi:hypothetical protein CPB83DRAFT_898051 [Crepidotus variabilis]|uniref:NAD(P)-binding protein n=1 Tax=Crepidotus variabilis TaxID=179855 RepID=A0A9P6E8J0_9AGAR|nr:hypothetical protein CPB83DRAFT_898051 [Crepidotus variabilis]